MIIQCSFDGCSHTQDLTRVWMSLNTPALKEWDWKHEEKAFYCPKHFPNDDFGDLQCNYGAEISFSL